MSRTGFAGSDPRGQRHRIVLDDDHGHPFMCDRNPSASGLLRYPSSDGFYQAAIDKIGFPCECCATCEAQCDGRCGCFACALSTFDRVMTDATVHASSRDVGSLPASSDLVSAHTRAA